MAYFASMEQKGMFVLIKDIIFRIPARCNILCVKPTLHEEQMKCKQTRDGEIFHSTEAKTRKAEK